MYVWSQPPTSPANSKCRKEILDVGTIGICLVLRLSFFPTYLVVIMNLPISRNSHFYCVHIVGNKFQGIAADWTHDKRPMNWLSFDAITSAQTEVLSKW